MATSRRTPHAHGARGSSRRLLRACTAVRVQDGTLDNLVKDAASACKPGHKRCNLCSEEKAIDDFSTTSKGRSSYCASCERLVRRGHNKGLQMETMRTAFKDGTIHAVRHRPRSSSSHPHARPSMRLRDERGACHGFAASNLRHVLRGDHEMAPVHASGPCRPHVTRSTHLRVVGSSLQTATAVLRVRPRFVRANTTAAREALTFVPAASPPRAVRSTSPSPGCLRAPMGAYRRRGFGDAPWGGAAARMTQPLVVPVVTKPFGARTEIPVGLVHAGLPPSLLDTWEAPSGHPWATMMGAVGGSEIVRQ